jgi:hypothetical protein
MSVQGDDRFHDEGSGMNTYTNAAEVEAIDKLETLQSLLLYFVIAVGVMALFKLGLGALPEAWGIPVALVDSPYRGIGDWLFKTLLLFPVSVVLCWLLVRNLRTSDL